MLNIWHIETAHKLGEALKRSVSIFAVVMSQMAMICNYQRPTTA